MMSLRTGMLRFGVLVVAAALLWPTPCLALSDNHSSQDTTQNRFVLLDSGAAAVRPAKHDPSQALEPHSLDAIGCPLVHVVARLRVGPACVTIRSDLARPDFDCSICASLCRFVV